MIKRRIILTGTIFIFSLCLSACLHKETPTERMYMILENTALAEKGFEQVQDPLVETEKKEKADYDKIIQIETDQYNQKVNLSNDAIKMVNERRKYMEKETKSLQGSEKEFKKVKPLIAAIQDKKLKDEANELYNLMHNRYKTHETLSKAYLNSTGEDQKLYKMFENKNVSDNQLEAQVEKLNSGYRQIYSANAQFNLLTQKYNEKKLKFYKDAGLIKE